MFNAVISNTFNICYIFTSSSASFSDIMSKKPEWISLIVNFVMSCFYCFSQLVGGIGLSFL